MANGATMRSCKLGIHSRIVQKKELSRYHIKVPVSPFEVGVIFSGSPLLNEVKRVWRRNSRTLGFFPDGAFEEHANKGQIFSAYRNKVLLGYLLFRLPSNHHKAVSITHLCVNESSRKSGVARALIARLRDEAASYAGMKVLCRRDYEANEVWPRLGFHPIDERAGRNKAGKPLTYWWYDFGHETLFSKAVGSEHSDTLVVLDSNVFYDIQDPGRRSHEEAKSLVADWLEDEIQLCVTGELYQEINRNPSNISRSKHRKFAMRFHKLVSDPEKVTDYVSRLRPLFRSIRTKSDESDLRHIAQAIDSNADFFVTRDEDDLIKLSEPVNERFGLRIVRPAHLVTKLDELLRQSEYQPVRVLGSKIHRRRVTSADIEHLSSHFQAYSQGERKPEFLDNVHRHLANPATSEVVLLENGYGVPLALYVSTTRNGRVLDVPLLRLARSGLAKTIVRGILQKLLSDSKRQRRELVVISDAYIGTVTTSALVNSPLVYDEMHSQWLKFNFYTIGRISELVEEVEILQCGEYGRTLIGRAVRQARNLEVDPDPSIAVDLERQFSPAKLTDARISSYLVPIRPFWAMQLFDERLAEQSLFGTEPSLALNWENVYYKSATASLSAPARILWYVSSDKQLKVRSIRAISYLVEVVQGRPSDLYKQFGRLGIYKYRDVADAVGKKGQEAMALRFCETEQLARPIGFHELQRFSRSLHGKEVAVVGAAQVSPDLFCKIYQASKEER